MGLVGWTACSERSGMASRKNEKSKKEVARRCERQEGMKIILEAAFTHICSHDMFSEHLIMLGAS